MYGTSVRANHRRARVWTQPCSFADINSSIFLIKTLSFNPLEIRIFQVLPYFNFHYRHETFEFVNVAMALESHSSNEIVAVSNIPEPMIFSNQLTTFHPMSISQPDASARNLTSSNDFTNPAAVPSSKPDKWPTKEDWETHRPLIKQLYQEKNKPLAEVMRFMKQEHAFRAT